jgi:hypothetical protein
MAFIKRPEYVVFLSVSNIKILNSTILRDFKRPPEVGENFALFGYYAASSGDFLPKLTGCCPETSVMNCHYSLHNNQKDRSFLRFCIIKFLL